MKRKTTIQIVMLRPVALAIRRMYGLPGRFARLVWEA